MRAGLGRQQLGDALVVDLAPCDVVVVEADVERARQRLPRLGRGSFEPRRWGGTGPGELGLPSTVHAGLQTLARIVGWGILVLGTRRRW